MIEGRRGIRIEKPIGLEGGLPESFKQESVRFNPLFRILLVLTYGIAGAALWMVLQAI